MSAYIPESLRTQIRECDPERISFAARHRCCYCLTSEANSGLPMSFDHIHPQSTGGNTSLENVCLACRSCNEYKSDSTEAQDPLTGEIVPLFHPRAQQWPEHLLLQILQYNHSLEMGTLNWAKLFT